MYSIIYDELGNPTGIKLDNKSIPINMNNADFRAFLAWNAQQSTPLDYQTPITPPAPPASVTRQKNAKANAHAVSILGTMSDTDAQAYIESHSQNIPDLKALVKLLYSMVIALRDARWPDLPDT